MDFHSFQECWTTFFSIMLYIIFSYLQTFWTKFVMCWLNWTPTCWALLYPVFILFSTAQMHIPLWCKFREDFYEIRSIHGIITWHSHSLLPISCADFGRVLFHLTKQHFLPPFRWFVMFDINSRGNSTFLLETILSFYFAFFAFNFLLACTWYRLCQVAVRDFGSGLCVLLFGFCVYVR